MIVYEKNVGNVSLTKNNYVASGGEGSIYTKGSKAYKIYLDPKKTIPTDKMTDLSEITYDNVIRPLNLLTDKKNNPIGYSMRFVGKNHPLCQIFTKSFKNRFKIDEDTILSLVDIMEDTVRHIHSKDILIVDLNELNFLVSDDFKDVYFIDVDSYQTKNYKATAIMESIRDEHTKSFNEGSDWFSFAVVSFQMFLGIHPYKGKYLNSPTMPLNERKLANISVFNKDVKIPRICPPIESIPKNYRDWYFQVFEEGLREAPPKAKKYLDNKITKYIHVLDITGDSKIDINLVKEYDSPIINYVENKGGYSATQTSKSIWYSSSVYPNMESSFLSISPKLNNLTECYISSGYLNIKSLPKRELLYSSIKADDIMSYEGRVYVKSSESVYELVYSGNTENVISFNKVANVLDKATRFYEGVVIQDLLGSYYASLFPDTGLSFQLGLPDLKGHKIIDAKFDFRVLMVISFKEGRYLKTIYKLNSEYKITHKRTIEDISLISINFVTLPSGVTAHIQEDGKLELFSLNNDQIKTISSDKISLDMRLFKRSNFVLFSKENKMYRVKTKG